MKCRKRFSVSNDDKTYIEALTGNLKLKNTKILVLQKYKGAITL